MRPSLEIRFAIQHGNQPLASSPDSRHLHGSDAATSAQKDRSIAEMSPLKVFKEAFVPG
jgi:hypothetical protein